MVATTCPSGCYELHASPYDTTNACVQSDHVVGCTARQPDVVDAMGRAACEKASITNIVLVSAPYQIAFSYEGTWVPCDDDLSMVVARAPKCATP